MTERREFLKAGLAAAATLAAGRAVPEPQAAKKPPMKVILWCWDSRMTWDDEPDQIHHRMAASTTAFPYPKRPESYRVGFRRLVDYCAELDVHAVLIWGFLRDAHGGVGAAAELCAYASDRGVAVIPGVGLCFYGGFYFEGDHPFNLDTYLRKHPDRASKGHIEGSEREEYPVLDPSLEANQQWWRDGLEWMIETFRIGGVNFEMGDHLVNASTEAQQARAALGFDCNDNLKDVVVASRELIRHGLGMLPNGLFINSTYHAYGSLEGFPDLPFVKAVPPETVWQYNIARTVRTPDFATRCQGAPKHRRYGYLHWFNASTKTMDKDYVADVARVFPGLHQLGFEFVGTYGEISALENPLADRNYRAQVAWARDPDMAVDDF